MDPGVKSEKYWALFLQTTIQLCYSSYSGDVPKMMSDECDDDTDTGGD